MTRAAFDLDATIQNWRRRVAKRELGQHALRDLGLQMDQAQLDVLMAIWAPSREFGADCGDETMVSTIAQRLGIDPSRASRQVSDLIAQGHARRAVSQNDARRTIVELTDSGIAIVRAVRAYKFLLLGEYLSGWTKAEIDAFVPLLERFSAWSDTAGQEHSDALDAELAVLKSNLREALD